MFTLTSHSELTANLLFSDLAEGNTVLHAKEVIEQSPDVKVSDTSDGIERQIRAGDVTVQGDPFARIQGVYYRNHNRSENWFRQLY